MIREGITLDTGALIGLERGKLRAVRLIDQACAHGVRLTIPMVCVFEFCQGNRDSTARILRMMEKRQAVFAPLSKAIAMNAAEAVKELSMQPGSIDALVMATAALRGDGVLTSDVDDMMRLQAFFPSVRVFGV